MNGRGREPATISGSAAVFAPRLVRTAFLLASLALALRAAPLLARDEPRVTTRLGDEQIYQGESVLYQVTVENVDKPPTPVLEGFDDFEVEFLGDKSLNSRSIRIVNGQATESVQYGKAFVFKLTPRKAGALHLPKPKVTVDGKLFEGPPEVLTVVAPQDQDTVLLEVTSDHPSVYPLQPFTVTLRIGIKALPAPLDGRNPLGVQENPPALSMPWIEPLPDGLAGATSTEEWLAPIERSQGAGFTINGISLREGFSFFERGATVFQPKPKRETHADAAGADTAYWEYVLQRTFLAQKPGTYGFGPVTMKGTFATGYDARHKRPTGEDIFAVGKKIFVTAKEPPAEGRPATYTGAIGQFELHADLAPRKAKVGDPMTLTLTLRGPGTLEQTSAPDLKTVPQVDDAFRLYEATEEMQGQARTFTYSLRPKQAGIRAFPSVALSYFDVERERYVTLTTDAIPIEVAEADRLAGGDIVAATTPGGAHKTALEARKEGIFANLSDLSEVRDESVRPALWYGFMAVLAALYAAAAWGTARRRRLRGDPALLRRRAAAGRARERLRAGRATLAVGALKEGGDQLRTALVGLVADAADLEAAGLTPRDVGEKLAAWQIAPEVAARIGNLLDRCDALRYGSVSGAADALGTESEAALESLLAALSAQGRLR